MLKKMTPPITLPKLAPCGRVVEKLLVAHIVEKFPAFNGTLITVFKRACNNSFIAD
jgi:hypothetical protein